ncbi:GAF and ANTAR domain-containing protein [Solicola gregarius]|uniref:GAF and ANTAR domain-containing protein n=1 Tax=Solicola gregarius TaxID=2908642 RepID=A0AA46YKL7_9ACTN|nr:GAF and ANTAR domain-containing protein [Solicola gregarius]UYM05637.1 GAF and ANTAR domain-containing protein [Solicola gregarius]
MIPRDELSEVFVEVADTLVADFDLVEFLHNLATRTVTISGLDAAGLLLADQHGQLRFMASSSEQAKLLELFQLQNSEGPCLDTYRTGEPVLSPDLDEARSRWPLFADRALADGFRSVHAIPMRLQDKTIGALNLFGGDVSALNSHDTRVIQALADVATIAILQEQAIRHAETLSEQLQGALNSRITIEQAKGALAQAHGVDVSTAFQLLRDYARSHQARLTDVAHRAVTHPEGLDDLFEPVTD